MTWLTVFNYNIVQTGFISVLLLFIGPSKIKKGFHFSLKTFTQQ